MQDEIEVRDLLQSILDSALDALITVDLQGRVVEFNQVAAEMFGYDREFALGRALLHEKPEFLKALEIV